MSSGSERPVRGSRASSRIVEVFAVAFGCGVAAFAVWQFAIVASWTPWHENPLTRDLDAYFYPKWAYAAAATASGRIPLWNPLEFCGMPFLATAQVAALYPVTMALFWAMPAPTALQATAMLHLGMASAFEYAWARSLGLGRAAAGVGAVLWAFNPDLLASTGALNRITTLAWTPLVFLLFQRALRRRTIGAAGLAAAAIAMMTMAGYPLLAACACMLLGVLLLDALWRVRRDPGAVWRTLVAGLGVGAFVLMFTAPQVLPLLEIMPETTRGDLVKMWTPAATPGLGDVIPAILDYAATRLIPLAGPAIGLIAAALVLGWRAPTPMLVAGLVFVQFAAGPGDAFLRVLPGFSAMRAGSASWTGFLPLFLATLAAVGFDRLEAPRSRVMIVALMLAPLAAWGYVGGAASPSLTFAFAFAVLLAVVLCVAPRTFVAVPVLAVLLAAVVEIRLAVDRHPTAYPSTAPTAALSMLMPPQTRGARVFAPRLAWDGTAILSRLRNVAGYEGSMHPRRVARLLQTLAMDGDVTLGRDDADWSIAAQHLPLLDLLDVGLTVAPIHHPEEVVAAMSFSPPVALGRRGVVYRRPTVSERVRVVHRVRRVASEDDAFAAVTSADFVPALETVMEEPWPTVEEPPSPSSAHIVTDEPERVVIDARLATAGVVVLSDAWFPGWDAWLDGAPVEVRRADFAFRAIAAPAGTHSIELRYRPRGFLIGLGLAIWAAVIALAAGLQSWRLARSVQESEPGSDPRPEAQKEYTSAPPNAAKSAITPNR